MLEALGLEYEVKPYARDPVTELAPESLSQVHPLGKSPVISDQGLILAESGAIIDYLAHRYGQGKLLPPADSPEFQQYRYWLHYAEGSLMPLLVLKLIFDKVKASPMPFFIKPIARAIADKVEQSYHGPNIQKHINYLETHLASQTWFAGEHFSAADIQMSFPLEAAGARGVLDGNFPQLKAFLQKIHAMPDYQRALAAGGPYDYV